MKSPSAFPFQKKDINRLCLISALVVFTVLTHGCFLQGSFVHQALTPIILVFVFLCTVFSPTRQVPVSGNDPAFLSDTGIRPLLPLLQHVILQTAGCIPKSVEIDLNLRQLKKKKQPIKLTAASYDLLTLFPKNGCRVMPQNFLFRRIAEINDTDQRPFLFFFCAGLLKKTKSEPNQTEYMLNSAGAGGFELKGKK